MNKEKLLNKYPDLIKEIVKDIKSECENSKIYKAAPEKDYTILAYKIGDYIYHQSKSDCNMYIAARQFTMILNESQFKPTQIYSVKRNSDGAIFTIGDSIYTKYCAFNKIVKFSIASDYEMFIWNDNTVFPACRLSELIKQEEKKVLFTTEDKVDLYEKDFNTSLYRLSTGTWDVCNIKFVPGAPDYYRRCTGFKIFSTKEARDEYIKYNKPLLSLKEIANYVNNSLNVYRELRSDIIYDFKRRIEDKLK